MAVNELKLCMGCMSPQFEDGKCSVCGYDASAPANLNFLPPKTRLEGRYLVGKMVSSDPEGAWYVGYDLKEEQRIWVREYVPANISRRDHGDFSVRPLASAEAQYKALMSDFEDLCRSLMRLPPTEKVLPVTALVYANNTVYAVYRYIKTITLESFLQRSGGKLSWRHTKKLLMPLYHTVANIHKAGLIHRGLSPRTIHLDQSGALWLSCFTVAAARTNKSELSAQLFPGYSAPEQYSLNSWQGPWTDVYALGAITYRVVTGEQPPAAMDRVYGDDLLDSQMISAEMTENVVTAINRALAFEVEDRLQTAEAFISCLLATAESGNTAVYTAPVPRRPYESPEDSIHREEIRRAAAERDQQQQNPSRFQQLEEEGLDLMPVTRAVRNQTPSYGGGDEPPRRDRQKRKKRKRGHPVLSLVLSALIATALLGGAVYWFATHYLKDLIDPSSSSSSQEAEHGTDYSEDESGSDGRVPRFVGATAESIKLNQSINSRYILVYEDKFNVDYEAGVVFDQQPIEGTELGDGGQVTLYVSKGPETVEMPQVVGQPIADATALLTELGIKFDLIPVHNNTYEPNVIVRADKEPGTKLDKERDSVMLYIKEGSGASEDEESGDPEDDPDYENPKASSSKKSSSKSSSSKKPNYKVSSKASSSKKSGGTVSYDRHGNVVINFDDD